MDHDSWICCTPLFPLLVRARRHRPRLKWSRGEGTASVCSRGHLEPRLGEREQLGDEAEGYGSTVRELERDWKIGAGSAEDRQQQRMRTRDKIIKKN